jgi:DNA-binding NarL/FixJ family response regulator
MSDPDHLPITVLLVDPHTVGRAGLASLLDADSRFTIVRAARTAHEATAERLRPDLIVVDPGVGPRLQAETITELAAAAPEACICVRAGSFTIASVLEAIHCRVNAYILKNGHVGDHLLDVLQTVVHTGGAFIDGEIVKHLRSRADGELVLLSRPSPECRLAPRAFEVLCLLADGHRPKEIAACLNIAESTVETHIDRARDKLGARTNEQLIAAAVRQGLLP